MSKIKLSKKYIYKICKDALKEDLYPSGDITSKLLKNTKKINGHQLIAYTIEAAKQSKNIKKIFVSTDGKKIAKSSKT